MADKQSESDERFAKVYQDPRFRTLRKKDKKLKIDQRFKSMFTEDKFTLKYSLDKRGRSRKHLIAEDYKKFYRLEDDESNLNRKDVKPEENDDVTSDEKKEVMQQNQPNSAKLSHKFGYHRGLIAKPDDSDVEESEKSSSSSSSSESEDEEEEEEDLEHDWGELDKDAQHIDHSTHRIAICNADWDRINAQDLYVLVNSFKPSTGSINSIRVYYSKFGEERLKVEEEKGPSQFIFGKPSNITTIDNNDEEEDEQSELNSDLDQDESDSGNDSADDKDPESVEKLRKYQLERLKYFYAVIECNSSDCAEVIYKELDGLEYESSSTTLDIRFVPDDMSFDDVKLKEECCSMPGPMYKAPSFTNAALQQSNVKITWDETDPRRKDAFNKAFDEDNEDDIKAYLASSSDSDEDVVLPDNDQEETVKEEDTINDTDKINKYKKLIASLDDEDENDDYDMKVSWEPKLKSNTKDLLTKRDSNVEDHLIDESDDDNDTDLSSDNRSIKNIEKSNNKSKPIRNEAAEEIFESKDARDLELLMMDVENDSEKKKHFNYKEIVENFKKNKQSSDHEVEDDGFKFDPNDSRFKSIYDSHLFNIDQSDPNFKRTKAFEEVLKKQKQKANRMIADEHLYPDRPIRGDKNTTSDNSKLNSLVRKVKNKIGERFNDNGISNHKKTNKLKSNKFNPNKKFRR